MSVNLRVHHESYNADQVRRAWRRDLELSTGILDKEFMRRACRRGLDF